MVNDGKGYGSQYEVAYFLSVDFSQPACRLESTSLPTRVNQSVDLESTVVVFCYVA